MMKRECFKKHGCFVLSVNREGRVIENRSCADCRGECADGGAIVHENDYFKYMSFLTLFFENVPVIGWEMDVVFEESRERMKFTGIKKEESNFIVVYADERGLREGMAML